MNEELLPQPMPKLVIDNLPVEVPEGATILDAARKAGIDIPTLCLLEGRPAVTSCMVCVVRLKGRGTLVPSCGYPAQDGLEVESETESVRGARRAALELLLGDHLGDCEAPCQGVCPAHLDIPRMIRRIDAGDDKAALDVARDALVLPGTLGRICPAPCQRGCRRAEGDGPLHPARRASVATRRKCGDEVRNSPRVCGLHGNLRLRERF